MHAVSDQERWDERYRARGAVARPHSAFLEHAAPHLPAQGAALDVAGGDGRNALWLAARGLDVTVCDVSPLALAHAEALARERDLILNTARVDLESDPLPAGRYALVLCVHYLQRSLFPAMVEALAPGGVLLFCQPTRRNLERHEKPSQRFLLEEGELPSLLPPLLEVVELQEGWLSEGRHEARVIARRKKTILL
jgi:tellurite methyltransferase